MFGCTELERWGLPGRTLLLREHRAPPHAGCSSSTASGADRPRAGHHCPAERAGRRARPPAPPETPRGVRSWPRPRRATARLPTSPTTAERPDGPVRLQHASRSAGTWPGSSRTRRSWTALCTRTTSKWRTALESASGIDVCEFPLEFRIRCWDREVRWVRFASNPVRLPDGSAAGVAEASPMLPCASWGSSPGEGLPGDCRAQGPARGGEHLLPGGTFSGRWRGRASCGTERPDEVPPLPDLPGARPHPG